jgi:hypothetical protein
MEFVVAAALLSGRFICEQANAKPVPLGRARALDFELVRTFTTCFNFHAVFVICHASNAGRFDILLFAVAMGTVRRDLYAWPCIDVQVVASSP